MNKVEIRQLIRPYISDEWIKIDEPMKKHTTFKIGGPADVFVSPQNEEELMQVIKVCNTHHIPYYIIGNGSNLLVSDQGFRGVIIEVFKNLNNIEVHGSKMTAYGGATLGQIATIALKNTLTGIEFAHGIPGTLGGAVAMNAGAYGGEMKDVLEEVTVIDSAGQIQTLKNKELNLGYRTSRIQKEKLIVLKATLRLEVGKYESILETMKDLASRRKEKQPLEYPSAGSTFKRPEGYYAGKLIMDSDLRGYQIGGAKVSDKHCGFIINAGHATFEDVTALIQYVQEVVYNKFNVHLEPEVRIIGEK